MKNVLTACDFVGFKPSLFIEGERIYKSALTGVLSILIAISAILCTCYFGSELIIHSTPFVIESRETLENFGPMNFSNKEVMFMFAMEYQNNSLYTDERVFSVNAEIFKMYYETNSTGQINQRFSSKNVKMDICSNFYTDEDILEKNMKLPLDKYYCAEPDTSQLEGFWGASVFSTLRIHFDKCQNSTLNNFNCKTPEEIDEIVQGGFISIKYTTHVTDQKNQTHPLLRVLYDDYNILNAGSSLEYAIELRPLKFNSDDGLMFPNINTNYGLTSRIRIFNKLLNSIT
jgi:hypothetical protein